MMITHGVFGLGRLKDSLLGGLGCLCALEIGVVNTLWNLDSGNVNLGRGGDNVSGGNTSHWDTVDLVRSSNKAEAGVELLQENASLLLVQITKLTRVCFIFEFKGLRYSTAKY